MAFYVSDPVKGAIHTLTVDPAGGRVRYRGTTELDRPTWEMEIGGNGRFMVVSQAPDSFGDGGRLAVLPIEQGGFPAIGTTPAEWHAASITQPPSGRLALSPDSSQLYYTTDEGNIGVGHLDENGALTARPGTARLLVPVPRAWCSLSVNSP